jgi:thymidylate synthase (FAD)
MRRSIPIYEEVGDDYGRIELVDYMGSDQAIIDAARVSFAGDIQNMFSVDGTPIDPGMSWNAPGRWRPEKDPKLLRYLIKNQHWSPFEHCTIKWHIVVPLFVRGQWHRHRTWSYNEVSRRYTSEDLRFYEPTAYRFQAKSNKQASDWSGLCDPHLDGATSVGSLTTVSVMQHVIASMRLYESMLEAGIAREQARMVLPQNMYVRFYGTVNLRNALAFIQLREDNHAQWEIYQAAKAMREHLEHLYPEALKAWDEVQKEKR